MVFDVYIQRSCPRGGLVEIQFMRRDEADALCRRALDVVSNRWTVPVIPCLFAITIVSRDVVRLATAAVTHT